MKNLFGVASAALIVASAAISCSHKTGELLPASTFPADSASWNDTITVDSLNSVVGLNVKYPAKPGVASDSINKWIAEQLDAQGPDQSLPVLDMVKAIGNGALDSIHEALKYEIEEGMRPAAPQSSLWDINDIFYNGRCVTFTSVAYVYRGGAHGSTLFRAQTFGMKSGRSWGYDMFCPDSLPRVHDMVIDGLMKQYFDVDTKAELEGLLLVELDNLTLPDQVPYFTDKGVGFTYQQYEIAPYSAGMPSCVIPYDQIKAMLSPNAAKLLYDI